jgi:hypothetical protein
MLMAGFDEFHYPWSSALRSRLSAGKSQEIKIGICLFVNTHVGTSHANPYYKYIPYDLQDVKFSNVEKWF